MIADVRIQNLVDDYTAHHETHGSAESENETDRGAGSPVVLLKGDKTCFGQHADVIW